MTATLRTFIAIDLPDTIIDAIARAQAKMKKYGLSMRWVKPKNIHLTLKFLGDIDPEQIPPITRCIENSADTHPPFTLSAKGVGVFPGLNRPRVLWTGINGDTDRLKMLQHSLEDQLSETGIDREARPFAGHLTLGRLKGRPDQKKLVSVMKAFAEFETKPFSVTALTLFESQLTPSGAVYSKLAEVPLQAKKIE